jgi:S-adenosylmethionine synthetase
MTYRCSLMDPRHLVREQFNLTPSGLIKILELERPSYQKTAAYGLFGRELSDFTWGKTDRADLLRKAL